MIVFEKTYDGESIIDLQRDAIEAFDSKFNPLIKDVPEDEHGFHKGTFKVSIEWVEDVEDV